MDLTGILGIIIGFGMLVTGYILEHGKVSSLFLLSPALIVFGGTFGALMLSFSKNEILSLPKLFMAALKPQKFKPDQLIDFLVTISEKARKEGLLSVEEMLEKNDPKNPVDPFLKRGMLMSIDGYDVHKITDIMENDIYVSEQKKKLGVALFEAAGGYSPTMGIIGTVMGLVQVLSNMGTPDELAKSIAVAFIATLYGVCFANLVYLPIASKLKVNMKYYRIEKELIIDGIASIQSGENPKTLREKLTPYLEYDPKAMKKNAKKES
ncbi:MAG: hypothetical protein K0R90_914 [Oscillospiraceae bacterium]|jgi:chemotaxis protein MotA|nr:hypothetical protein [Oscillospiraceae bacterium]